MLNTKAWSPRKGYTECVKCKKNDSPHKGQGLCSICYHRKWFQNISDEQKEKRRLERNIYVAKNRAWSRWQSQKYRMKYPEKVRLAEAARYQRIKHLRKETDGCKVSKIMKSIATSSKTPGDKTLKKHIAIMNREINRLEIYRNKYKGGDVNEK